MIDLDRPCPHDNFTSAVEITRLVDNDGGTEVVGYSAQITTWCVDCGERFRWIGIPEKGVSPRNPTTDITEEHLIAPLRPAGSDPDFGLGLPGISTVVHTPLSDLATLAKRHNNGWKHLDDCTGYMVDHPCTCGLEGWIELLEENAR